MEFDVAPVEGEGVFSCYGCGSYYQEYLVRVCPDPNENGERHVFCLICVERRKRFYEKQGVAQLGRARTWGV